MPLGSEAADHEIVNGNVTEAESAGLSGRGAEGAASAGATPTRSPMAHRTSETGNRAVKALPVVAPSAPLPRTTRFASRLTGTATPNRTFIAAPVPCADVLFRQDAEPPSTATYAPLRRSDLGLRRDDASDDEPTGRAKDEQ